ncbi:MAG: TIGR04282 family arsenosugar biosynthesis glycosyltransferase [Chitinophagaceae bacterium]
MNQKNALIIFVRKPEYGKVKTRLAAALGKTKALEMYELLLQHTHAEAEKTKAEKFIFYTTEVCTDDRWNDYKKFAQRGNDLGSRMENAFKNIFDEHYENIIIIGSDCFELTSEIISLSFSLLEKNDVVIGPAKDGGYYLLGMKKMYPTIFENIPWSTSEVFNQTIQKIQLLNLNYELLPVLSDVDTVHDLPDVLKNVSI